MPDETATESWETEDEIDAENINPEVPKELWDSLVWQAIRTAIDVSQTKEEVLRKVKQWNNKNNPRLPEKELIQKVIWALHNWDTKFRKA